MKNNEMQYIKKITSSAVNIIQESNDGYAYRCLNGLVVIQSESIEQDGKWWIHTSFSRRSRMPEYKDMAWVKKTFIGPGRQAIMVFPEESKHINLHWYCLHFFTPCENTPLPDFTQGKNSI